MRASEPVLLDAGRVIAELRDSMVSQWADWLGDRASTASTIPRTTVEREFRLLFDVLAEMAGPMRREANTVWFHACEHYGRIASARGLADGLAYQLRDPAIYREDDRTWLLYAVAGESGIALAELRAQSPTAPAL